MPKGLGWDYARPPRGLNSSFHEGEGKAEKRNIRKCGCGKHMHLNVNPFHVNPCRGVKKGPTQI